MPADYAREPDARYLDAENARRAIETSLPTGPIAISATGYRLTAPNLEEVGLLRFGYASLD